MLRFILQTFEQKATKERCIRHHVQFRGGPESFERQCRCSDRVIRVFSVGCRFFNEELMFIFVLDGERDTDLPPTVVKSGEFDRTPSG